MTDEAVALWRPELIVAPFLKRAIPESIWRNHRCIVVHPGIRGDRGPSALDWAIADGETEWGVTVLEANGEMDAGDVWASVGFPMRDATKGSLYRNEVTEAAVAAIRIAIERLGRGERPEPVDRSDARVRGRPRPLMRQPDRAIDWRPRRHGQRCCARSAPPTASRACSTTIAGARFRLFDAHPEGRLRARHPEAVPARSIAQRDGAICRATIDGAVWITHLSAARTATRRGSSCRPRWRWVPPLAGVPEAPLAPEVVVDYPTWRPIRYEEARRGRLPAFPVLQRRDGQRALRALRAAFALRDVAADAGDRADGRPGLLVERDPPQPDRGVGRTRPRNRGATSTRWTTSSARSS